MKISKIKNGITFLKNKRGSKYKLKIFNDLYDKLTRFKNTKKLRYLTSYQALEFGYIDEII